MEGPALYVSTLLPARLNAAPTMSSAWPPNWKSSPESVIERLLRSIAPDPKKDRSKLSSSIQLIRKSYSVNPAINKVLRSGSLKMLSATPPAVP